MPSPRRLPYHVVRDNLERLTTPEYVSVIESYARAETAMQRKELGFEESAGCNYDLHLAKVKYDLLVTELGRLEKAAMEQ